MIRSLLLILLSLFLGIGMAYPFNQKKVDSLQTIIQQTSEDTTLIKTYNALAEEIRYRNTDSALNLSQRALRQAQNKQWEEGIAQSYHNIGLFHYLKSQYSKAITYYNKALPLWQQQNNTQGYSKTLGGMGNTYTRQGNYAEALKYYQKALKMKKQLNNKDGIANNYVRVGYIHWMRGRYAEALNYYFKALNLYREIQSKSGISLTLGNIGNVYKAQQDYSKALDYYFKALKLRKKIDRKDLIASTYNDIGIIYNKLGDNEGSDTLSIVEAYSKAKTYYYKALRMDKKMKDKRGVAVKWGNIGVLYTTIFEKPDSIRTPFLKRHFSGKLKHQSEGENTPFMGQQAQLLMDTAMACQQKSLHISRQINDKRGIIHSMNSIGYILVDKRNYQRAIRSFRGAHRLADTIGALPLQKKAAHGLYKTYKKFKKHNKALHWLETYLTYKDTLFNKQKQKKIGRLETRYKWQKQQLQDSLKHAKEMRAQELKHQHEIEQQRYLLYSAGGGLVLVLVFASILYNRFRVTQRHRDLIQQQKQVVDAKNREITSSINYAKRIQEALLKEEAHVTPDLPPHFVFHKPQATVSGDFYWSVLKGEEWYVAVADCTGHGVPGGFLTMLGMAFLNEITSKPGQIEPAEILNQLRERFIKELGEEEKEAETGIRMRDGMDISLLRFNLKTKEAQWAGANNPLYVISDSKLQIANSQIKTFSPANDNLQSAISNLQLFELPPDKQPISYTQNPRPFTNHELKLQKNDALYLFSDGYPDQFGGPKGKKFMYKRFKKMLCDIQDKDMDQQKEYLDKTIEDWMVQNDEEQIDDICVLGVKV